MTVLRKAGTASKQKWKNSSEQLAKTNVVGLGSERCGNYAIYLLSLILNKIPCGQRWVKFIFLVYIRLIVEEVSEFVQKSSQTLLLSCEQPIMSFLICGELSTFYQNRALTFIGIFF